MADVYEGWQRRAREAGHCTSECPAQFHHHNDPVTSGLAAVVAKVLAENEPGEDWYAWVDHVAAEVTNALTTDDTSDHGALIAEAAKYVEWAGRDSWGGEVVTDLIKALADEWLRAAALAAIPEALGAGEVSQ